MPLGEDNILELTDADVRKRGERIGLETLVVHAVNDEYYFLDWKNFSEGTANALNTPPRDYSCQG